MVSYDDNKQLTLTQHNQFTPLQLYPSVLSDTQIHQLIRTSWDHPDCPMKLASSLALEDVKDTPLFFNTVLLLNELLARQHEPTATKAGYLPPSVVRCLSDRIQFDNGYAKYARSEHNIIKEYDLSALWTARLVCNLAGLIRRRKNKFLVTPTGVELLKPENAGTLYHLLFMTFFTRFNIGFYDRLPELDSIQKTIAFSLYQAGKLSSSILQYDALFSKYVLPQVLEEIRRTVIPYIQPRWVIARRVIEPMEYAGLVQCSRVKNDYLTEIVTMQTTTLYQKFIRFEWNE